MSDHGDRDGPRELAELSDRRIDAAGRNRSGGTRRASSRAAIRNASSVTSDIWATIARRPTPGKMKTLFACPITRRAVGLLNEGPSGPPFAGRTDLDQRARSGQPSLIGDAAHFSDLNCRRGSRSTRC
jgi:hypothetical protein